MKTESKPGCSRKCTLNKKTASEKDTDRQSKRLVDLLVVAVVRMRGSILGIRIFMPIAIDPPLEHLHQ